MSYNLEQGSALNAAFQSSATGSLTGLTGAATTHTVTAVPYILNGLAYFKATAAGAATPTTDGSTGAAITLTANKARAVVWALNAAGTVSVYAGPIVDYTDTAAGAVGCPLPVIPGSVVPFAAHTVQAGSTTVGTWTFGSSNWNATGIGAITVRQLGQLPNAPLLTV